MILKLRLLLAPGIVAATFACSLDAWAETRDVQKVADSVAAPMDATDHGALAEQLSVYLGLVAEGDSRYLDHHRERLSGDPSTVLPSAEAFQIREMAMDDGGELLGAELSFEPKGGGDRQVELFFFRLAAGRIADIIPVTRARKFLPGNGTAPQRPEMQARRALPETVPDEKMNAAKFSDYVTLFGRFDERFVQYYAKDVTFTASPAPAPPIALNLYRPLRANLGENMTVHQLVIDSQAGLMMVALTNRLTAYGEVELPGRKLLRSDRLTLSGAIIYGIRGGKIALIGISADRLGV